MKYYHLTALLLLTSTSSIGQLARRFDNETPEQFAERIKPDSSTIVHQVIETNSSSPMGKAIIIFYSKVKTYSYESSNDTLTGHITVGYLFVEKMKKTYRKVLIDSFDIDIKIESVFFANADKDISKELCVLISDIPPPNYCKCEGTYYSTKIYDSPKLDNDRLDLLPISSKFLEFEGFARWDDEEEKAKFKTAGAIKRELTRLGFSP